MALCFNSVFAMTITFDQSSNLRDYKDNQKGNILYNDIVGSISQSKNQYLGFGGLNGTRYYYDFEMEFNYLSEDFYLIINNYFSNASFVMMYRGDLTKDDTLYIQNLTFNEQGRYYFKINPDYIGESGKIYFEYVNSNFTGTLEYQESKPQGFNELMGGIVVGFNTIIDYNIALWRIAGYILIFVITLSFVISIFWIGFTLHAYRKRIQNKKRGIFYDDED